VNDAMGQKLNVFLHLCSS